MRNATAGKSAPAALLRGIGKILLVFVLLGSWAGSAAGQNLLYAGDIVSTRAFMADLIALYEARGKPQIGLELTSSTSAIRRAASGGVEMGGTSRAARATDRQERRATVYPIVWDALVVIVHPTNGLNNISLPQLRDLYLGRITNWQQLGGNDHPIEVLIHQDPLEGIDYNLAELLMGDPGASLAHSRTLANTEELETAVESGPWALAVTTYSSARKRQVKLLAVEGRAASVPAIQNGDYLLYIPLYLAVREDSRKRREVREFVRFATTPEAKRVLRRNGVVPYADGLALTSKQLERADMLNGLRAGD